jgi:hypothetical protein
VPQDSGPVGQCATHGTWLVQGGLLPELPGGELCDDVEVSCVLLDQMEQDALESRGVGTGPTRT